MNEWWMIWENDLFMIERDNDRRARIIEKGTYRTIYHFEDEQGIERAILSVEVLMRVIDSETDKILLENK